MDRCANSNATGRPLRDGPLVSEVASTTLWPDPVAGNEKRPGGRTPGRICAEEGIEHQPVQLSPPGAENCVLSVFRAHFPAEFSPRHGEASLATRKTVGGPIRTTASGWAIWSAARLPRPRTRPRHVLLWPDRMHGGRSARRCSRTSGDWRLFSLSALQQPDAARL